MNHPTPRAPDGRLAPGWPVWSKRPVSPRRLLLAALAAAAAARLPALGLSLSPVHIQASTTAASEAPFLALLLGATALLLGGRLAASALLLAAAGMVRYDGWLYLPLFAGWLLLRRVPLSRVALFCALAALPVPLWL